MSSDLPNKITVLQHGKVNLALHHLRDGDDGQRALLLLHGLGHHAPDVAPAWTSGWRGPVVALDFTGHGQSTIPRGGGYSAETLLADADIALSVLEQATVVGHGLGAYVALQLAGARATSVRGAVLADGTGLVGGPVQPLSSNVIVLPPRDGPPDPYAMFELSRDLRPPDYSTIFARMAVEHSGLEEPLTISALIRPPWLAAVADEVGVAQAPIREALEAYALVT